MCIRDRLPVGDVADEKSHLYLWVPNALLPEGLQVMEAWGFEYKTNLILSLIHISAVSVRLNTGKSNSD